MAYDGRKNEEDIEVYKGVVCNVNSTTYLQELIRIFGNEFIE